MDSVNAFRLDWTLKKLAKIALVVSFWEKDDVKRMIRDKLCIFNTSNRYLIYDPYLPPEWPDNRNETDLTHQEIINYIFEKLSVLKLSKELSDEIKVLIIRIGQKIYFWRQYVKRALQINTNWADEIYWTSYGDIDEWKIIQEFWLKDLEFPKCNGSKKKGCRSYSECMYFCESLYFQIAKNEIFREGQTVEAQIAMWIWFRVRTSPPKFTRDKIFSFSTPYYNCNEFKASFYQLQAKDLLFPCIDLYFEFGVKHTWKRLTTNEKNVMVAECAERCLFKISSLRVCKRYTKRLYGIPDERTNNCWEKEKGLQLFLFFINEMSEIQRSEFLEEKHLSVYKLIALVWPYQELCEKFLKAFPDFVSKHYSKLLELNINRLILGFASRPHCKPMYVTNQNFYYGMLLILFDLVPKPDILNFFIGDNFKIIKKILRKFNFSTLNFILKNVDLKDYRNEILEIGMHDFKQLLCRGRYTVFHEVIQNLKLSDSELKLLKQKFDLLTNFLTLGDFESADEYLNWRYDTEDEKSQIKNQVDAVQFCSGFVLSDNFQTANNFLIWRFDTEDERKAIKKALNLTGKASETDFIRNKIFDLKTPEKCYELLKWFFESEEDITEFRKTKIIQNDFFFEKCWDSKIRKESLDEFLIEVCLMSSDEIENFKTKAANNINWYIDTFALGKSKFKMVNHLFDWIYKDKNEKRNIIKKYMNSPRGCLLCIKLFEKYDKETFGYYQYKYNVFFDFLKTWIENGVDYSELPTSLIECNISHLVSVHTLEWIKLVLHQIKKEKCIDSLLCRIKDHKSGELASLHNSGEDEELK